MTALVTIYNISFESMMIGRDGRPQIDEKLTVSQRHLSATLRFTGRLRSNASSDRVEAKRRSIEHFKGYRLVCLDTTFDE